ncbi:TPA: AAA family ATPase [Yersinia enterocolitica]|nr:AAA family ATPase [Yersinia enterocolitica]
MRKNNNMPTQLKTIEVIKFRGLKNVKIKFGKRITAICGKNGTSKSTILGILAQIFSFKKDVSVMPNIDLRSYKTLTDKNFESVFSEHFRFSKKFDKSGDMQVKISVYDAYTGITPPNLELKIYNYTDREKSRPVVRNNTTVDGINQSRNITHPVIFLSLKRLIPISHRENYDISDIIFFEENKKEIKEIYKYLISKNDSNNITGTTGTINSMVMHSDSYDHDSVSVGEDNIGQIVQALFSFRNLKENYDSYHGGMLLIDEADAGLFPAAQRKLVEVLEKECKKYNLQVVFTTHSPTLIETLHTLAISDKEENYKVIYLTDTYGSLEAKEDYSWLDINSDLHVDTIDISNEMSLPRVNVYFEDKQAYQFYSAMVRSRNINKITRPLRDISLSCNKYIDLIHCKIPEFAEKSIIVFDGDVSSLNNAKVKNVLKNKNSVLLPTDLAPDQLLFEFLYNLPPDDDFWRNNPYRFTKPVFIDISTKIINRLNIEGENISLMTFIKNKIRNNEEGNALRDLFKDLNTNEKIEKLIAGTIRFNPYAVWAKSHPEEVGIFLNDMIKSLKSTLLSGHHVSSTLVDSYFIDK